MTARLLTREMAAISARCSPLAQARRLDPREAPVCAGRGRQHLRGDSDLAYAPTDPPVDRTVQAGFETFYDHRLKGDTDLGVAVGANVFVVPNADAFVRWSVEPRLTLKLFDLRKRNRYAGTASLRLGVLALFGEFLAENFGRFPARTVQAMRWGSALRSASSSTSIATRSLRARRRRLSVVSGFPPPLRTLGAELRRAGSRTVTGPAGRSRSAEPSRCVAVEPLPSRD